MVQGRREAPEEALCWVGDDMTVARTTWRW